MRVALCAHFERGDRHVFRGGLDLEARAERVWARVDHVVHAGLKRNESPVTSNESPGVRRGGGVHRVNVEIPTAAQTAQRVGLLAPRPPSAT